MRLKTTGRYQIILENVRQIPKGKVATYGEIARLSGFLNCARLVGYALNSLPDESTIPWHRVVNSQGKISFPKYSTAYKTQQRILKKEGIIFESERIDLKKYGWLQFNRFKNKR
jgi:methylated-DNA-protein-cysteine methyltransferase related protein